MAAIEPPEVSQRNLSRHAGADGIQTGANTAADVMTKDQCRLAPLLLDLFYFAAAFCCRMKGFMWRTSFPRLWFEGYKPQEEVGTASMKGHCVSSSNSQLKGLLNFVLYTSQEH